MDKHENEQPANLGGRWLKVVVTCLLGFTALELLFSRYHFLDDAFIHLRIAHHLADHGRFEYNDGVAGFMTSSPLYTTILAIFSKVSRASLLPKIQGDIVYLVVLALIARSLLTCVDRLKTVLLLTALVIVTSPMGIRWLTDGMETGMILLLAILLAILTERICERSLNLTVGVTAALVCAAAIFLRVEFGYLVAVAVVTVCLRCFAALRSESLMFRLTCASGRSIPFVVGGLTGVLVIIAIFGHLLPDTAVAKQTQFVPILKSLQNIASAHLGASFFGVGMFGLWCASVAAAGRFCQSGRRLGVFTANSSMVVFILLLVVTRQSVQGVRYFVFIETFLTTLNILVLRDADWTPSNHWLVGATLVVALIWIGFDATIFHKISGRRSETYLRFARSDYAYLEHRRGIVYDTGFVGYFTDGYVLDACGLVNGRDSAKLNIRQRLLGFATHQTDFVFVNDEQWREVREYLDLSGWETVGTFDFPNFRLQPDTHRLIVRPELLPVNSVK